MYFPNGGSSLCGISKPGEIVWSRIFVEDVKVGRGSRSLNRGCEIDSGDGGARFNNQVGGAVPAVATFEGADLLNWGAANSNGADYATMAVGFRSRISSQASIGLAYEFPLTDEEDNITDERFTFDLTYTF